MTEKCPDFLPEFLHKPKISRLDGYTQKRYDDGLVAIIGPLATPTRRFSTGYVETRFVDGSLHYETKGVPEFYANDQPESRLL